MPFEQTRLISLIFEFMQTIRARCSTALYALWRINQLNNTPVL